MNERTKTVIFSHGHLSSPESMKIAELTPVARAAGFDTLAVDYRDLRDEPVARAKRLMEAIGQQPRPPVLVGSSMGGWVAMHAAESMSVAGLFLMAPALFFEDRTPGAIVPDSYSPRCRHIAIIHGWHDDIIPWQHSLRFARASTAALHLLDSDHRLESALRELKVIFQSFIGSVE